MQTFLPLSSYSDSARVLDYRRLGKQRVECKQIYNALTNGGGWENHPAVRMWRGYENSLLGYMAHICMEWRMRGYNDTLEEWALQRLTPCSIIEHPPWIGDKDFHDSHKSNLLRKDPDYYSQFKWDVPMDLPYVWPLQS